MVCLKLLFIWHSGNQYQASGICRILKNNWLASLPVCLIARLPACLTARKIQLSHKQRFWKTIYYKCIYTTRWIRVVLLSLCLIFLSNCTTRRNLRQNLFLSWPLKANPKISRNFSPRSPHDGIDIVAPMNREIFSAHEGYVVYAGSGYNGYGRLIILDSGQGWSTFYAHLNRIFVKEGVFVQRGDIIGTIGMTGKTSGPHLHFELRRNKVPVDPRRYLP